SRDRIWSAQAARSREVHVESRAARQLDGTIKRCLAAQPRLQRVMTRREAAKPESAFLITRHKIRRIEDEDQSTHVLVNVTTNRDQAGNVKDYGRNRSFIRAITSEIETLRGRERKNIVIRIIKVRKF